MGREDRYRREKERQEIAELSAGVTRAIATLIHVDDFIQRTADIFIKYTDADGTIDLEAVPQGLIFENVALLYKLQHGTFKGDADLLRRDIQLISQYNQFNYLEYTQKMHEMILEDVKSGEEKKD